MTRSIVAAVGLSGALAALGGDCMAWAFDWPVAHWRVVVLDSLVVIYLAAQASR